ncbi:hypothetical protein [Streptomyces dangxiongensis]|uniref:hypothetical protein n=1 Tax=Streptomyces dangxiongensis TaxID=1442032 RepID=UPI0013CE6342|nr:hypothetical protein [Streptomyces dangxiongensis]
MGAALDVRLRLSRIIVIVVVTAPVPDWAGDWRWWAALGLTVRFRAGFLYLRF